MVVSGLFEGRTLFYRKEIPRVGGSESGTPSAPSTSAGSSPSVASRASGETEAGAIVPVPAMPAGWGGFAEDDD